MPKGGNGGILGPTNTTDAGIFKLPDVPIKKGRNEWVFVPVNATGGTVATASGYKTHTFSSSGTFNCDCG